MPVRYKWIMKLIAIAFGVQLLLVVLLVDLPAFYSSYGDPGEPPYLTFFLLDGVSAQAFAEELAAGNLPNIQKMVDEGFYVENGVTAFPSITAYAYVPFITGQDAAFSGVLAQRWFDRRREFGNLRNYIGRTNPFMNKDMDKTLTTLYESFPNQYTRTLQSAMSRGVSLSTMWAWFFTTAKNGEAHWLFKLLSYIPFVSADWEEYESHIISAAIAVQWVTMASMDSLSHVHGMTPKYRTLLRLADENIGKYREASKKLGQEDNRIYAVIADHGMTNVTTNFDLTTIFRYKYGLRSYTPTSTSFSGKLNEPITYYDGYDIINTISGNCASVLYFRKPGTTWHEPLPFSSLYDYTDQHINLVQTLVEQEGVDVVITKGPTSQDADVSTVHGHARISSADEGKTFSYSVVSGSDPLNYVTDVPELVNTGAFDTDTWLTKTVASNYPYAPVRIWRLMNTPAMIPGDIVVTAKTGFDFVKGGELFIGSNKGGHGSIARDTMLVPYVITGPGVAHGRLTTARAEDVGQTLIKLMDATVNAQAVGQVLTEALQ